MEGFRCFLSLFSTNLHEISHKLFFSHATTTINISLVFQKLDHLTWNEVNGRHSLFRPFDMKGCICHFVKWQIHPLISKGTICYRDWLLNAVLLFGKTGWKLTEKSIHHSEGEDRYCYWCLTRCCITMVTDFVLITRFLSLCSGQCSG